MELYFPQVVTAAGGFHHGDLSEPLDLGSLNLSLQDRRWPAVSTHVSLGYVLLTRM